MTNKNNMSFKEILDLHEDIRLKIKEQRIKELDTSLLTFYRNENKS